MIHGLDLEINNFEKANSMLVEDQKAKLARNSDEFIDKGEKLTTIYELIRQNPSLIN